MGGQFEQTVTGNYGVQDRSDSYFGNRFWLQELDELDVQPSGVALLTGSSDAIWFEKATPDPFDGTYNSPPGIFSTLQQELDGSFTLTDHFGFVREFDITGLLQKRVDPNGNETRYLYGDANGDGQPREIDHIVDPFQRETVFHYDPFGMVTSIVDFAGRETTLTYENDRLASLLQPDPDAGGPLPRPETVFTYAANGRLADIRDARNETNSLAYDGFGLVSGGVNADGSSWSLSPVLAASLVDPTTTVGTLVAVPDSERFAEHIDSRGYTTQTTTDAFGLLTSLTDALHNRYLTNRDLDGRVTSIVEPDPDGDGPLEALVTRFEYASCTNISQLTFADGSTSRWTYNEISQPLTYVDELGRTTLFEYDTTGFNLTKRTRVMGADDLAGPRPANDPDDIVFSYTYTGTGSLLPTGLVLSETDPLGRTTLFTYETDLAAHDFGWLKQVTYAAGTDVEASIQYEYDAAGNVTAFVDELGHRTEYTYDDLDRLVALRDADPDPNTNGTGDQPFTQYAYDLNDNLIHIVDAEGNTTQFTYDEFNRLVEIREERPDGPDGALPHLVRSFTYDRGNNLTSEVDPAGRVTVFHYDALNRQIAIVEEDVDGENVNRSTNPVNRHDVDADGTVDAHDLASISGAIGDPSLLTFDPRLSRPDYFDVNGDGLVTSADFDSVQAFIDSQDTNGDGQVDVAEIAAAGVTPDYTNLGGHPITIFEYDNVGNVSAMIDANGNRTAYRYDQRHRLIETTYPTVDDETGTPTFATSSTVYDDAGQVITEVDPLGRTTNFEYDDAGRLTKRIEPDAGDGSPTTQ
jgi:YD repeat-containing protein